MIDDIFDFSRVTSIFRDHYSEALKLQSKRSPKLRAVVHWFESLRDPSKEDAHSGESTDVEQNHQWGVSTVIEMLGQEMFTAIQSDPSVYHACKNIKDTQRREVHAQASLVRQYQTVDFFFRITDVIKVSAVLAAENFVQMLHADPGLLLFTTQLINLIEEQMYCSHVLTFSVNLLTLSERATKMVLEAPKKAAATAASGSDDISLRSPSDVSTLLMSLACLKYRPFDPESGNEKYTKRVSLNTPSDDENKLPTSPSSSTSLPAPEAAAAEAPPEVIYFVMREYISNGTLSYTRRILINGIKTAGLPLNPPSYLPVWGHLVHPSRGAHTIIRLEGSGSEGLLPRPPSPAVPVEERPFIGGEQSSPIRSNIHGDRDPFKEKFKRSLSMACPIL